MVHPVSTFQWSDVGFREVGSGASIHIVGRSVMINRCRSRATPATRERDLRLLLMLGSWYVARGRADAPKRDWYELECKRDGKIACADTGHEISYK
jgi:hypothetical protein